MRKVIDTNFFNNPELIAYLSRSTNNSVVIIDYAAMEIYKTNNLPSIYSKMEILSSFSKQVIVLKSTRSVCRLNGNSSGLQKRLIDKKQTQEFSLYCKYLLAAKQGNLILQKQLLDHSREATNHINLLLTDATNIASITEKIINSYDKKELVILRTRSNFTQSMVEKVIKDILLLAAYLFKNHPDLIPPPHSSKLPNTFIFRAALCQYLLILHWISEGSPHNIKPENIRNTLVDMYFATYATYFDGLLSQDKIANKLYQEAAIWLKTIFAENEN